MIHNDDGTYTFTPEEVLNLAYILRFQAAPALETAAENSRQMVTIYEREDQKKISANNVDFFREKRELCEGFEKQLELARQEQWDRVRAQERLRTHGALIKGDRVPAAMIDRRSVFVVEDPSSADVLYLARLDGKPLRGMDVYEDGAVGRAFLVGTARWETDPDGSVNVSAVIEGTYAPHTRRIVKILATEFDRRKESRPCA